jgi:hypothetical protein
MGERVPQTVAFGGGGFSMEAGNRLLDDYLLAQDLIYVGGGRVILCGLSADSLCCRGAMPSTTTRSSGAAPTSTRP